jgi:hypothetical protein
VISAKRPEEVDPAHRYKKVTHHRAPGFIVGETKGKARQGLRGADANGSSGLCSELQITHTQREREREIDLGM